jgi:brefeldin A-inhibited guanine nucleotide-exchange protein
VASCVSLGGGGGDDALELAVLRVLVAFTRCLAVSVSGECLGQLVKACYNVYLESASGGTSYARSSPAPSSPGSSSS